jgi:hypothetical protein
MSSYNPLLTQPRSIALNLKCPGSPSSTRVPGAKRIMISKRALFRLVAIAGAR